jgi:hypothetical protein
MNFDRNDRNYQRDDEPKNRQEIRKSELRKGLPAANLALAGVGAERRWQGAMHRCLCAIEMKWFVRNCAGVGNECLCLWATAGSCLSKARS